MGYRMTHGRTEHDVTLISIPHTGTHWLEALLEDMGLAVRRAHLLAPEVETWLTEPGPIVVPLRDPMMAAISCLNRDHPDLVWRMVGFARMAEWTTNDAVHFFRVDCPVDERRSELAALERFVGVPVPATVDWTPKGAHPDEKHLKAAYEKGRIPEALDGALQIIADPVIVAMFRGFGYELPWMPQGVVA